MSDPQAPPAQPPKKGPGCIVTGGGGFLLFCFAFVGWSQLREARRPRVVMLYWEREHGERTYAVCVAPQPGRWTYGGCRWCPDGSNSTSPMCVCWSPTEAEHACPVLR